MCSILYLKSVRTLWLSLFTGLLGFLYDWNNCLPFVLYMELPALLNFTFSLDFFSYKILHANYLSLLESAFLKSIDFILLFHYYSFWTAPDHFMVRLPKFTPLLTRIKLNRGSLNFCTLSIPFYITWWIVWFWGKRLQFPINCNSRIKDLCNCLETFCSCSLQFLLSQTVAQNFILS